MLLAGLVVSTVVAVVGAVIALVFGFLWIRDVTRPVRTPAPDGRARDARGARPPARRAGGGTSEAEATYPRNTFLAPRRSASAP